MTERKWIACGLAVAGLAIGIWADWRMTLAVFLLLWSENITN